MPGTRKFVNGEFSSMATGIVISAPSGEMINTPPPPRAPIPRNAKRKRSALRAAMPYWFIKIQSLQLIWFLISRLPYMSES